MKYNSARSLYNDISKKYKDNRKKASNDYTELPTSLRLIGDLKGKNILDMGCGLGTHLKEFIKRGGKAVGYDISEKMLKIAEKSCDNNCELLLGSHETIDFPKNEFDNVNASLTINYSKDIGIIFKKVNKWLKPGGTFTFSVPHPVWLLQRVEQMDYSKSHKIIIKMSSYDIEIFNYYHPLNEYIQAINENSFKIIEIVDTTIPRRIKGKPEEKYRLPNTMVFKLMKL